MSVPVSGQPEVITEDELAAAWKRQGYDESCLCVILADIADHRETTPPAQPDPLVMPADEFAVLRTVAERFGIGILPPSPAEDWTPEQLAEFKAAFDAAVANPGPLRVLPSDHWKDRADAAEARLAEVREVIRTFFVVHGNNTAASLTAARDLAEGIRQVLDRVPLGTQGHGDEKRPDRG